ncbi:dihydroorotase, homodimeric type [Thioalkalivibrio sulfidiphilus HL-EbGr7]|uniref:Dihydroorotase n=1 Tax=Thioalkalivibrio sulfidiphilus (strain HL-EbGR7) TaxID=396588 RepID=B8GLI0_THISH|nr:dihydroorotase [Thioalkalivibrio sulfidiphilus]ACL73535.1 dihydroorotase, homodimeric type [Thioalkalivibrio sulfidiphilus HL-EbGr7]
MTVPQTLTLRRPDDWHLHLRDGAVLKDVVPHTAARFARAIIMPNLKPPVTTTAQAEGYRDRILAAVPEGVDFTPLMTLYLTDATSPEEIQRARDSGIVFGVKLYPAGATTHSDAGVTHIRHTYAALEAMQAAGLPLLIHGEATDPAVDVFDREAVFIEQTLAPLRRDFPELKIVFEHITTADAVAFVREAGERVGATVTPQHILMNRNALFQGGIRPHHYCLPVLKRESHRKAIMDVLAEGHPRFFLGTDSAPHAKGAKESACGCAGIYSAHGAIELYAEAFEQAGALDRLEGFASLNGPRFYGLPVNEERITLVKQDWEVPGEYPLGGETVVPLRAGGKIGWKLV